jgi:hypothetical protein
MTYKIPKLTRNEIETLQVDAAMRTMGNLSNSLVEINQELGLAISDLGQARVKVEKLKADKQTVVELMRALKVLVQSG